MNISREEKMTEALRRLEALRIYRPTVKSFKEGKVSTTEPPHGATYWMEGRELELVRQFEEEYNALVYLVVRSFTTIGTMDAYLYVSDHPDEWPEDREMLKEWTAFAYVRNYDHPDCSEFGDIGVRPSTAGGLLRAW